MAAIRCRPPSRSMARPGASSRWSIRRRKAGWRSIWPPATASDLIRGCTLRRQPSGWPAACAKAGAELIAVDSNPLDSVWTERPAAAARPGRHSRHAIFRRGGSRKAAADPARDRAARRRCAGAVGFACGGLDLQHPRRRRLAYAAAAVLCAGAEGRPAHGVHRSPQAFQQRARPSRTDPPMSRSRTR